MEATRGGERAAADVERQIVDAEIVATHRETGGSLEPHGQASDRQRDVLQVHERLQRVGLAQPAFERRAQADRAGHGVGEGADGERQGLNIEGVDHGGAARDVRCAWLDGGLRPRAQLGQEGRAIEQPAGEPPAQLSGADEVADRAADGQRAEHAAATRGLQSARSAELHVQSNGLHGSVDRGIEPAQLLTRHRQIVGAGQVVHSAGPAQLSGALVDREPLDFHDRAPQARVGVDDAEMLALDVDGRGAQGEGDVGRLGRATERARRVDGTGEARHRRPRRHQLREVVGVGSEGTRETPGRHPHRSVAAHAQTRRVELEACRAERVAVVDDVGERGRRSARGQGQRT